MTKKNFWIFAIVALIAFSSPLASAYTVIAIDEKCNIYEDGKIQGQHSRGMVRYEVSELTKTVTETQGWVESLPDTAIKSDNKYSILAIDNPVPVSDIERIRQRVIHAVYVGSYEVGSLKNSHPTLLVLGENYFKRYYYNNGFMQISEGKLIRLTSEQAKELSFTDFREFNSKMPRKLTSA